MSDSAPSQSPRETLFRIKKLRKAGFDLPDDATVIDCWKCKQVLLRRTLGIADDATYAELFEHILTFGLEHGGTWELFCDTSIAIDSPHLEQLRRSRAGDVLQLIREPESANLWSVKVCQMNGSQLGYLPEHIQGSDWTAGFSVANDIDKGCLFVAILRTVSAKGNDPRLRRYEYAIQEGDLLDDAVTDIERSQRPRFNISTLMAHIDLLSFNGPPPNIDRLV